MSSKLKVGIVGYEPKMKNGIKKVYDWIAGNRGKKEASVMFEIMVVR